MVQVFHVFHIILRIPNILRSHVLYLQNYSNYAEYRVGIPGYTLRFL